MIEYTILWLSYEFATEFEYWLKSVRNCNHNTSIKYVSNLKKIVNICLKNGWLPRDPFIGYKMNKREVIREVLSQEDIDVLMGRTFATNRLDHSLRAPRGTPFMQLEHLDMTFYGVTILNWVYGIPLAAMIEFIILVFIINGYRNTGKFYAIVDFIAEFSAKFKTPIRDNSIAIPASIGKGSIKRVEFGEGFKLIIHHYNLIKDFTIKRNAAIERNDLVSIFFYNNEQPIDLFYNGDKPMKFSQGNDSAIQITSSDMNSIIKFPANSETHYCVVGIPASKLLPLLNIEKPSTLIQKILSGKSSFVYFETMNQETKKYLKQLAEINVESGVSCLTVQMCSFPHILVSSNPCWLV